MRPAGGERCTPHGAGGRPRSGRSAGAERSSWPRPAPGRPSHRPPWPTCRACTSCPRVPGSSTRPGRPREKQSSRRGSPRRTPTWPPSGSVTPSATTAASVVFRRDTAASLPPIPPWLRAPGEPAGAESAGPEPEPPGQPAGAIEGELRRILARITGRDELAGLPGDAPLFGDAVALDSLTGTLLLREVQRRFGVDVAGTDLNLDALATLGTLASFVAGHGGS